MLTLFFVLVLLVVLGVALWQIHTPAVVVVPPAAAAAVAAPAAPAAPAAGAAPAAAVAVAAPAAPAVPPAPLTPGQQLWHTVALVAAVALFVVLLLKWPFWTVTAALFAGIVYLLYHLMGRPGARRPVMGVVGAVAGLALLFALACMLYWHDWSTFNPCGVFSGHPCVTQSTPPPPPPAPPAPNKGRGKADVADCRCNTADSIFTDIATGK